MAARLLWKRVRAGIVAVLAMEGCLDPNPKFEEPTQTGASDSLGASSTAGDPTDAPPTSQTTSGASMTDGGSSGITTTTTATTDSMTETTGASPVCGDKIVQMPEECDDGPNNADDAACTSACKMAVCGDGLIRAGEEYCEDLNDDPADGCVGCFVPHVCKEVQIYGPGSPTGIYLLDPDANGPSGLVPVFCDMELKGGGWTRIERSPLADPIGKALFVDFEVNYTDPTNPRYRMPRTSLEGVVTHSNEIWIDCGGDDHLWVDGNVLFAGEDGALDCYNISKVLYKEAQLGGVVRTDVELCTGFTGKNDGECPGAWRVDEFEQMICGLTSAPWDPQMSEMITVMSADIFAVDAQVTDPNLHDCHQAGAVRSILMR